MASQDEGLVQVQVLLDELTAGLKHVSAAREALELLLCKLLAGHALWDVPHSLLTAGLQTTVTLRCSQTETEK